MHSHYEDRQLERFRARRVEITADRPLPREVDGEVIFAGPSLTMALAVTSPPGPHPHAGS